MGRPAHLGDQQTRPAVLALFGEQREACRGQVPALSSVRIKPHLCTPGADRRRYSPGRRRGRPCLHQAGGGRRHRRPEAQVQRMELAVRTSAAAAPCSCSEHPKPRVWSRKGSVFSAHVSLVGDVCKQGDSGPSMVGILCYSLGHGGRSCGVFRFENGKCSMSAEA